MIQALKYYTKVIRGGKIEISKLPLKPGTNVEVIVLETENGFENLLHASETSTKFWNNKKDDEVWNNA